MMHMVENTNCYTMLLMLVLLLFDFAFYCLYSNKTQMQYN